MIQEKAFKAYDIRGIYPSEIDETLAYKIGQAYCQVVKPEGPVVVGMDVRIHSPQLKKALIEGLLDAGVDVVDIGLISTEMLYFAVGNYRYGGGIQVTASHNPAEYNGFKMTRSEAIPISSDTGIYKMRDLIIQEKEAVKADKRGSLSERDILEEYARFISNFVNLDKIGSFRIAHNPNFGFGGEALKEVIRVANLKIELVGLNDSLDGTFPKGQPDPFKVENRKEFIQFVKDSGVDLGVTWDADADRVFFCTGEGEFIEPYYTNAILIKEILKREGGGKIVYDPRYTWALIDAAKEGGGEALIERVGHSFIKERMRREDAIFSGESSGHTYFKKFWYADSGIIPLLMLLEILSSGITLDELTRPLRENYPISGEINMSIKDKEVVFQRLKERYFDGALSEVDGLSIEYSDWRANIRASNTEPLLRINIEAKEEDLIALKKEEILRLIS